MVRDEISNLSADESEYNAILDYWESNPNLEDDAYYDTNSDNSEEIAKNIVNSFRQQSSNQNRTDAYDAGRPDMTDEELMEALDEMLNESKMDEAEIEKGKFTDWCKDNGFEGPSISCAKKAMASKSKSAHKMATFYMNTVKPKGKTTKDI